MHLGAMMKKMPFLWRYADHFRPSFPGTNRYWEERYAKGGNSGSGSYGRLSAFKAQVLNDFVSEHKVSSVIEFGCGDGNQLSLASYPKYVGLDVSRTAIASSIEKFRADTSKSFFLYDPDCFYDNLHIFSAELGLSLDVIYHLIEDTGYSLYLAHLFHSSLRYVAIYSSNHDEVMPNAHVRHRAFSKDVELRFSQWKLLEKIDNKYPSEKYGDKLGSFADFYIYEKK